MSLQSLLDMVPNKLSDNKVITPYHIAEEMVNSVLNNIDLDLETTFLDPVCKSGVFLKILYDKLMAHPVLVNSFEKPEDRSNHILDKMLYGIALDETCQLITQRLLYGRVTDGGNIIYIKGYIGYVINRQYEKIQQTAEKEFKGMKTFGVIIGNPPYQENVSSSNSNKSLSKQLFPHFIICSTKLAGVVSLITPSRWFTADAQDGSFPKLREYIKANNHIKSITHFCNASSIFTDISIRGGVSHFIWDSKYTGDVEFTSIEIDRESTMLRPLFINDIDIILYDSIAIGFLNKLNTTGYKPLTNITTGRNPFGIEGKEDNVENIIINSTDSDVKLLCKGGSVHEISSAYINKNVELLKKHKVIISKSAGDPLNDSKVIGKPYVAGPMCACTDTFITIGNFENIEEAISLSNYIKTKFLRYAVSIMKMSQNTTQIVYRFVPLQDFTSSSDIDWNQPISEIDKQLYKKYNLTQEEIEYIEKTIKPMN